MANRNIKTKKTNWYSGFDPDNTFTGNSNIFSLPCSWEESELVIIPVPWDISNFSYSSASSPEAVLKTSLSISLFSTENEGFWKKGIFMQNIPLKWKETAMELRKTSRKLCSSVAATNRSKMLEQHRDAKNINYTCKLLIEWIERKASEHLDANKKIGLLGGDQGFIAAILNALSKKHKSFGVLYINAFSGMESKHYNLEYSQYSAAFPALSIDAINKIVLFGTRSYTYSSDKVIGQHARKIRYFPSSYLDERKLKGATWKMLINEALITLPKDIYVSINANILQAGSFSSISSYEPGGFSYPELKSILTELINTGKNIIGFDLCGSACETAADNQAAARLLFDICSTVLATEKKDSSNLKRKSQKKVLNEN